MHLTVSLLIECNGEITNGEFGVSFDGCAVVSHEQHIQAYSSGRDF